MLVVLGLIDVVMISNLLIMVIVGGYETFVSRLELERHPDQPEWLSHVNASVLKIKLAMAIIGISSIHLLRTFIYAGSLGKEGLPYTETGVMWQTIIHGLFILSAIGIAFVEQFEPIGVRQESSPRTGSPCCVRHCRLLEGCELCHDKAHRVHRFAWTAGEFNGVCCRSGVR